MEHPHDLMERPPSFIVKMLLDLNVRLNSYLSALKTASERPE